MTDLTIAEAIAAIRVAAKPHDDGHATSAEIRAKAKCGDDLLRSRLKLLLAEGRLSVKRVMRETLDGRWAPVPAYKVKGKR